MNNLSFLKWISFFESTIKIEDFKHIFDVFKSPIEQIDISPATIIDGRLTRYHNPFFYLESTDTLYFGTNYQYHRDIIASVSREDSLRITLRDLYYGASIGSPVKDGAIGRIGYGIDFDVLRQVLPKSNLNSFMENMSQKNIIKSRKEAKNVFNEIDIIAIYKCPIEIAARAVKKIQEKGEVRDPLKTIVIFNEKAFDFDQFIAHQKAPGSQEPVAPIAQDIKKEPLSFFPKDFKPKTWKDARKWAGLPPTIGDWTNNG
jgi:hypothetical protein